MAGRSADARFSAEQGQAVDYLHTHAETLLSSRAGAEMVLGEYGRARESCRAGSRQFPGNPYFIPCEAEVLGRSSRAPRDAATIVALADSLDEYGTGYVSRIMPDDIRFWAVAILARASQHAAAARLYDGVAGGWHGAVDANLLLEAAYARQAMGDRDSALALAARAVQQDPGTVGSFERLRWFQPLRDHPLFSAAMKGIPPTEAERR